MDFLYISDHSSPIFGLAILVIVFAFTSAVISALPFYQGQLERHEGAKFIQLDGLRGYLALFVFLTHALSSYYWYINGNWSWPESSFYILCGQIPVAIFFMVTGFLFWGKAISTGGKINWRALALSRIRRLVPLYIFMLVLVLIVVGIVTGWQLREPLSRVLLASLEWFGLGILPRPDINGLGQTWVINPAVWTLRYEWAFYAVLPIIAMLAVFKRFLIAFCFMWMTLFVFDFDGGVSINFVFGMLAAHLIVEVKNISFLKGSVPALISLGLLFIVSIFGFESYGFLQSIFLFPLFMCVVAGNSIFELLSNKAARLLGMISYSVYLLHGVILYFSLYLLNLIIPVAQFSAKEYWGFMSVVAVAVVCVAIITYRWIEHPYLRGYYK